MSIAEKFEVIADEVYEKGKKDEYDKFWDNFQNYGKRISFDYAFRGYCFNFNNFYPKYDIKPVGDMRKMFYAWEIDSVHMGSLKQRLEECGVTLNTSQATYFENAFSWGKWTELPVIDMSNETQGCNSCFARCSKLHTIEKIIVSENTLIADTMFTNDTALENLTIEGVIAKNNFNVKDCKKLSGASIVSIIEALSDTTNGLTVTLSQTAVDNMAFPIVGNKGTYNSWTDLEQSRTNWTISLV